jgi:Tfp pilus assembly protein PilV
MLMEVSVAMVLIAIALMTAAQLLIAATRQQQAAERRRAATCEASNILDAVLARNYVDVDTEKLATLQLADEVGQLLPAGKLSIDVMELDESPRCRRVQVEIGWQNSAGRREQVQLCAWKYAPTN